MWTRSRQRWISLAPGVPQYETQPEDLTELLQASLDYRQSRAQA